MANELTGKICDVVTNVCQSVTIDITNVPVQLSLSQPDYIQSAPFWGIAFSSVVGVWFAAHCAGILLKMIKNG